jgi:SAM-dependent methyltransferase
MGTPDGGNSLKRAGLVPTSRILDVGTGAGRRVGDLRRLGFRVIGVDPFVDHDVLDQGGRLLVKKAAVSDIEGQFDFVMLHHSLEHMADQHAALHEAWRLVRPGGTVLVRVPLVDSYAWRTYGTDWVQLDAPRHLYLHSERSLSLLATDQGFQVRAVVYDSTAFQFSGSELYRSGGQLFGAYPLPFLKMLRRAAGGEARRLRVVADFLNSMKDGDQAAFYLRRPLERDEATHVS